MTRQELNVDEIENLESRLDMSIEDIEKIRENVLRQLLMSDEEILDGMKYWTLEMKKELVRISQDVLPRYQKYLNKFGTK